MGGKQAGEGGTAVGEETKDAELRSLTDVAMVQAADLGTLHDPARLSELDGPDVGGILVEREVRASPVIVEEVCVQRRQTCSVGGSPTGARARRPVAWMAGQRETKALEPIDEPSEGWEREAGL
jgi:hypothetical protein